MTIAAQCRNFKLTLTKNEYKLSQIANNDIKWKENKAFWSKKIKSLLEQIRLGDLWMKVTCGFIAQLVEHRTGIAEVTGSNPVEALIFSGFFFPIA